MKTLIRPAGLLLALLVLVGSAQTADAQIWKRAKEKLQQKVEDKLEAKADSAIDKAADEAATKIVNDAVGTVGTAQGSGSPGATGADAANAAAGAAAGAALMQALGGAAVGAPAAGGEPVDFRALKALLPEDLPGLSRSEATGQKSSALGIKSSSAEASYDDANGESNVEVTITDMGSMTSWAMLGYAWLNTEMDSETETGYERTLKFKEYPAHEKYDNHDGYRSGEFTVVVGQRFVVTANGNGVDMNVLKAAADRIDFAELEKLKAESEAAAQPVLTDFRALKALLPEQAAGFNRTSHTGQQTAAYGIQSATAEAQYESGDRRVRVTVTDMGSMAGLAALGYAWTATQIDSESDRGFERTVKYGDHPGYQKFERNGDYRHAELQVVVKQRFVVALNGDGVEMADLEALLGTIDLAQLAAM